MGEPVAEDIKAVELKLIGDLFGDGYVMDFTNRTYQEFFRDEVCVDIYNDAYLIKDGNSKGKRLRAFMQKAQKAAIVKALHGLWKYQVAHVVGREDPVPQGRERLNALIVRLGGKPIAGTADVPQRVRRRRGQTLQARSSRPHWRQASTCCMRWMTRHMTEAMPSKPFLKSWFAAWGLDARKSFKSGNGEQVDCSFVHGSSVFLLEAKWKNAATDASALMATRSRPKRRRI